MRRWARMLCAASAAVFGLVGSSAWATPAVTIPDLGFDAAGVVTAVGTEVGTTLLAVVGLGFAVALVFLAYRLIKRVMGGGRG